MRDDDELADLFYGDTMHRDTVLHDPTANLAQPLEEVEQANTHWRQALRSVGVNELGGKELTMLVQQQMQAPADAATREAWTREASESLATRYGPDEARERIAAAKQLAQRDPRLAAVLSKHGLVSHPRVVALLAEKAHSLRLKGKL